MPLPLLEKPNHFEEPKDIATHVSPCQGPYSRIAQMELEHSVEFASFSVESHGLGSKTRFHPPDFNGGEEIDAPRTPLGPP